MATHDESRQKESTIQHSSIARRARLASALMLLVGLSFVAARIAPAHVATSATRDRGHYLVTSAGQCTDCHRPNFVGGPNLIPGPPGAPWAKTVPNLRGLRMFQSDSAAVKFLMTATLPNGRQALPPMPHYTFDRSDATAIVAYLANLK